MRRRNFLTELIREEEEKPRRQCRVDAMIYYCKKGLRDYTAQKAVVVEISTATFRATCPVPEAVSGHAYLVIERLKVKVPCAAWRRSDEDIQFKFYEEIPTELMERMCVQR